MLIKLETKAQLYSVFSNDEQIYQKNPQKTATFTLSQHLTQVRFLINTALKWDYDYNEMTMIFILHYLLCFV